MYYYTGFSFDVLLHSFRRRYACNDGYEILAQVVQFQEARTECVKPATYGRGTGTIQPSNRNYAKSKPRKWGGMCYPACKTGYNNQGSCTCIAGF